MANGILAAANDPADKQANISVQRYFEISLVLMVMTSFITLATTGKLDFISVVAVSAALLLKLSSYLRDADYTLSSRTVTRIAVFYVLFYGLDFLIFTPGPTLVDHMLGATVHLVLFATVIKVFSARTYRDYAYLGTLSFMMMLAAAILTVGTLYLVCFAAYLLFSISTFISYEIKRAAEAARRPAQGPYAAPSKNRAALEKALISATTGLAVGIVILASILFFVIPRYRTGFFTAFGADRQNITGFSESVNLGDIRKILKSNEVVMRVLPGGGPQRFRGVKWRGVALTSFDGKHWYNDNTAQVALPPASISADTRHFFVPEGDAWRSGYRHPLEYRVLLSALTTNVMFAAYFPSEVSGRIRFIAYDQTYSLRNPLHGNAPYGYDVISDTDLPPPVALRRASTDLPADIRLLYLRLPEKINPQTMVLARSVSREATNNYDRALAIQNYLRNNYAYSLDPSAIDPNDPIGSFLFKSKTGYCEYFASAMALMARAIGLPARVANGFQTGLYNPLGGDFVVRARDAHSWVEIYFPGYAWIPFDPTPPDPNAVAGAAEGAWADYLDAANLFWNEWIINYDFGHQVVLARQMETESRDLQLSFQRRVYRLQRQFIRLAFALEGWLMRHKLIVFLFMLAVLGALIAGEKQITWAELRFLWAWQFHQGEMAFNPHEAALTYQRFLVVLRKKGYRKSPSQTPREFALYLGSSRFNNPVREFTRLYNALRFGSAPVAISRLRQLIEEIGK